MPRLSRHRHRSAQTLPARAGGGAGLRDALLMRWLMGLLVLAMALGPALGQMHRVVHDAASAPGMVQALHAQQQQQQQADAAADCGASSWVHALFDGHGPAECQLLDQANHGYAGPPALLAFAPVAPESAQPRPFVPAPRAVFLAAPFEARAPPSTLSS